MTQELVFYTNPRSRGVVVQWALEEIGAPYRTEILEFGTTMKAPAYLAINPMGKVPAIKHGDQVVTEVGAILAYLAGAFPEAKLGPQPGHEGAWCRWLFFAASCGDAALMSRMTGLEPKTPEHQGMMGFGSFEHTFKTLEDHLKGRTHVAGTRFSVADIDTCSLLNFAKHMGQIGDNAVFDAYCATHNARPAAQRTRAIMEKAIAA